MTTAYTITPQHDRLTVLVLLETMEPPSDGLRVEATVDSDDQAVPVAKAPIVDWRTTGPSSPSAARRWHERRGKLGAIPEITYAKTVVDGLDSGTTYRVEVKRGDELLTDCRGTTLPGPETTTARLMFGSCHGVSADRVKAGVRASFLNSAHGRLSAAADGPLYQLWLGDQLYVDDPWKHGWKPTIDPHREIITRYRVALGLTAHPSALSAILAKGSNHFIPDDHEFWNNYPRASMATLPVHTASRVAAQVKRYFFNRSESPHPYHHGAWGRTAGAAFMAFQSADTAGFDEFAPEVSPSAVQTIDFPSATVAMVDTRWHRTMALRDVSGRARFLLDDDFDRLTTILERDHLVVLGLAKPIIGALSPNGWFNESLEVGPEDYRAQYRRLWAALNRRADRNLPTVVLAGDVHHHTARTALDGRLAEFVCSPMALIDSLDKLEMVPISGLPVDAESITDADEGGDAETDQAVNVSFNVKTHSGFSKILDRLKKGKKMTSQVANNAQARLVRRDRKPLRSRYSANRHPLIDAKGRLSYADGTQLFPPVSRRDQAVPKVECSGLASLDLDLDGEHPVIRYRAELHNEGVSDLIPRRVEIKLRWTGTRWAD